MKANATILIVDDHVAVLESMSVTLESEGYQVLTARDGVEALSILDSQPVDLILADIAMPRMNGYQLLERVRANQDWVTIPYLFLTARAMDSDVRYGKELGADDYLVKPIEPEDVLAAVQGRLLRVRQLAGATGAPSHPAGRAGQTVVLGRLRIDASQHRVWMDDQPIRLSAREFTVLDYLARRSGQVVSPEELIRVTHGLDTNRVEAGGLLRPLVRSVRRKLGYAVGELGCIETVRGVGYLLNPV